MKRAEFIKSSMAMAVSSSLLSFSQSEGSEESVIKKFHKTEDWEIIQNQFLIEKKIIYLNNGTMGINPKVVLEEIKNQFELIAKKGSSPNSEDYNLLKSKLASTIGVDMKTLAITKNVTEGINIACWGNELKKGDEVLMTTHEHVGGCAAWLYRSQKEGIVVKTFSLGNTAVETLDNFKKAITPQTKIVAVPHIPCTIGQILPVKEICEYARTKNIISIIDGAHPLGMIRFNIVDIGCDYYAGCLHKWMLGPVGVGFIYIRPDRLNQTNIYNIGAYSIGTFDMTSNPPLASEMVEEAQRFSTGTFCGPSYRAAAKAIDWYHAIGSEKIEHRVKTLGLYVQEELRKMKGEIEVLSPLEEVSRGSQTAFRFKTKKTAEFINFARNHSNIALRYIWEGKLDAVRVSTHYYNSEKQLDILFNCISEYQKL